MFQILKTRLSQGHRTMKFPLEVPALPERYRGRLSIDGGRCRSNCRACADACPTQAITINGSASIDLGQCVFCTACTEVCPTQAVQYTRDYRLAVDRRSDLVITRDELELAKGLSHKLQSLLGRALRLREVCAGGCNACDLDTNVLNTVGWDLSRFGIQFVASPRHADGVLVTGPISRNMELALRETYAAVPEPKIVIAVGACAISGGPFRGSPAVTNGIESILPVDLYIPGCPPHPLTILDGLLRLVHGLPEQGAPVNPPKFVMTSK
jgi:Ni,Fe-hydrogenase III small subunit/ferredoxin